MPLYQSKVKAPHCLMELSCKDYNRLKRNSITVCGLSIIRDTTINATNDATMTRYNSISYGENINISKKKIETGNGNENFQQINLSKSTGKFVLMLADKNECLKLIPNCYTFSSCLCHSAGKNKATSIKISGKLVLLIAALPTRGIPNRVEKIWNKSDFIIARKCKPNIMNSFHHHGSIGNCYSFGNKGNYAIVE